VSVALSEFNQTVAQRSDDPTNRAAWQYRFLCITWMTLAKFLGFSTLALQIGGFLEFLDPRIVFNLDLPLTKFLTTAMVACSTTSALVKRFIFDIRRKWRGVPPETHGKSV
jgi:hypothetical protein